MERLHKFIATAGIASRRKAEELIRQGRVQVNGEIVLEMGTKVGPDDEVKVDGETVRTPKMHYVLMNKPKGVVTTLSDPQRRPTVAKFLPDLGVTLKPVGRLDMETEGLLLFTNDGDLAARLTHPRYGVEKEYVAIVQGDLDERTLEKLRKGVYIEGGKTAPAEVRKGRFEPKRGTTRLEITIHEGRYRQIRQMGDAVGHPVVDLRRVRIGPLRLRDMAPGMCRALGQVEVLALKELVGLAPSDEKRSSEPAARPRKPRKSPPPKAGRSTDGPARRRPR
jgi:23S rRNA pseudouridine2605 synthase